ncbi:Hypothetical predicted protein [Lecanosticta acicola]|uniref:Uncharacterized protein n=1 Tax=Lecanosticta acicola TaxID=111012 RepID=A0AAI8YUS3_9PEZI|nr:Hypothetical predicted protein [Lecanosticta acicola]
MPPSAAGASYPSLPSDDVSPNVFGTSGTISKRKEDKIYGHYIVGGNSQKKQETHKLWSTRVCTLSPELFGKFSLVGMKPLNLNIEAAVKAIQEKVGLLGPWLRRQNQGEHLPSKGRD